VVCHRCQTEAVKFGINRQGFQRYLCKQCSRTFSDIPARPLDDLRIEPEKAFMVIRLLCEGTGIRACERLTGLNRRTVLGILKTAGQKCARLLDTTVRNIRARNVETDELYSFVHCKQDHNKTHNPDWGEQFTFLSFERDTKLIIAYSVGKRTSENAHEHIHLLRDRLANRIQLSTDNFHGYRGAVGAVKTVFGPDGVDYATLEKVYAPSARPEMRYNPPVCILVKKSPRLGLPERDLICTSHVERQNLNVRLFNRRFTRLTLGYSKKLANLKHSVALFVAFWNFCWIHNTLKQTPAMAAGLTDHAWTVEELLSSLV
jgi:transposase-like protein/IS1 family transposase